MPEWKEYPDSMHESVPKGVAGILPFRVRVRLRAPERVSRRLEGDDLVPLIHERGHARMSGHLLEQVKALGLGGLEGAHLARTGLADAQQEDLPLDLVVEGVKGMRRCVELADQAGG